MAKPNDTRITHVPANANPSTPSTPANTHPATPAPEATPTTPGTTHKHPPIPATSDLTPILQALQARVDASKAAPRPPKHARPKRIKPRRRVTVSTDLNPAGNPNTPWIHLCGHWLVPAGFALHTSVRVHVGEGFMLLIAEEKN